jgi:lipopolysaccharide/colanic/teichoic acid biosynthesis glycosyltransferase
MARLFDYIVLALCSVVLIPLIAILCLVVRLGLGSPIFFTQDRIGYQNRVFKLYKFRSMTNQMDADGQLLPDNVRLTALGRFLRASSLDELPSFYNLIRGDLRLVGPRPLLVEYLPLYSDEQRRRHDVPPGITGWAQVNGRNALSWDEKFALDVWYVENRSLTLDIKILFLTVVKVIVRDGINANADVTMPRFTGSNNDR